MLAVINSAVVLQLLDNLFVRIIWVNKANVWFTRAQRKQIRRNGYQGLEFAKGNKGQIDCFLAEIDEEAYDMEFMNETYFDGNTDGVGAPEEEYDDYQEDN